MPSIAFSTQEAFRARHERQHATEQELMLPCYKVHSGQKGVGYRQALDEALLRLD